MVNERASRLALAVLPAAALAGAAGAQLPVTLSSFLHANGRANLTASMVPPAVGQLPVVAVSVR